MATLTVSTDTNYSALSINDGDRITITQGATLTINTDTVQLERILCTTFGTCYINNTSTTTPIFVAMGEDGTTESQLRFEGGGKLEIKGAWIGIGTSDGTAGQTFTLPTNAGGDRYQALAGIQVVDGSDILLFNRVDSLTDCFGDEKLGLYYTHDVATGVITFGDGTEGYIPPNGATIRVPNIQMIDEHNGTGFNDIDLASSGTIDIDIASFAQNYAINLSSASSVQVRNACFDNQRESMNIGVLQNPVFRNVVTVTDFNGYPVTGSACNGVDIDGLRIYTTATSGTNAFYLTNGAGGTVKNLTAIAPVMGINNSRAMVVLTSANVNFEDVYVAGKVQGFYFAAGSGGHSLKRCFVNGAGKRNPPTTEGRKMFYFLNSANNFIEDCGFWPETVAEGLVAHAAYGLDVGTGTAKCTFNNCKIYCGAAAENEQMANPILTNGADNNFANIEIHGDFSGDVVNYSTGAVNPTLINIKLMNAETTNNDSEWCDGAKYELVSTPDRVDTAPANNGVDVASLHFYKSNDLLNGYLYRMMGVDNTLGLYTEVTKTGVITFNNAGAFYMGASGDVVEFETHVHYGITGFTYAALEGSGVGNFTCEFAMRRPDGTYGAYQSFSSTNMNSALTALTGYSTSEGLQIKYKITRTASNLTDYINRIRTDTTIEASFSAPFEVRPTDLTVSNLSNSDVVYVEDASNNQKAYEVSDGSDFVLTLPNDNAGETWTYVIKRVGYQHQKGTFTIAAGTDVGISASFIEKLQAVGGAMYTHSDVVSVDVEFDLATPQMSIDISQAQTSPQNVFDKVERALITNDGMKWLAQQGTDTAFQNLGGAGSFLFHQNNIRIRRNTPTDTNAEVLAFVFSTDGIAVDETNGTVAVFSGTLVKDVWEGIIDEYDDVSGSFGNAVATMLSRLDVAVSTRPTATQIEAALLNEDDGQQLIDAIVQAIGNENITAGTIATTVMNETIEGSLSLREVQRVMLSVLAGKVSGAGTGTETFRDTTDNVDRIVSTVDDSGNRTAVVIDGS